MANNSKIHSTALHEPAYENFVSETIRHCPMCSQNLPLDRFKSHGSGAQDIICSTCDCKDRVVGSELAKAEAFDSLAAALSKSTGRKLMSEAAPSGVAGVRAIMAKLGGESAAWDLVGDALHFGMTCEKADTAIKAVNTFVNMVTTVEKNQGEPLESLVAKLSDEDRMEILFDPARQLLLDSPEFRKMLLNDPSIRKALLKDAGIEVIEQEGPPL